MYSNVNVVSRAQVALIGIFIIASVIVGGSADSAGCYYCNAEAVGADCNAPLNTNSSEVRIQRCSDLSLVDSQTLLPEATNTTDYVCTTVTYNNKNNALITARSCETSMVSGREVCSYLNLLVNRLSGYVTNFACSACDTTLCNDSIDDGDNGDSAATSVNLTLTVMILEVLTVLAYQYL